MGRAAVRGDDQGKLLEVVEVLGASLDLRDVLSRAYGLLLPLLGADHGALAVTRGERPEDYDWIVQNLPPSFLGSYAEMAPHDFVRNAVIVQPNVVLSDAQMVDRRSLEGNMMYARAREVGSPIEHVMAVMLHVGGGWQSGLSLYRERRRSFSERDRACLQRITPSFAHAVENCRRFGEVAQRSALLDALLGARDAAVVVVRPPMREIDRTERASALLARWFPDARAALPSRVRDELRSAIAAHGAGDLAAKRWRVVNAEGTLEVLMFPLPGPLGRAPWAIELREIPAGPRALPPPPGTPLTKREAEVAAHVANGLQDAVIADLLDCTRSTVKKHVQRIFDKYGMSSRHQLIVLSRQAP